MTINTYNRFEFDLVVEATTWKYEHGFLTMAARSLSWVAEQSRTLVVQTRGSFPVLSFNFDKICIRIDKKLISCYAIHTF